MMAAKKWSQTFLVRWADLDPNGHLRHTVYSDYSTQVRFSYLAENGFQPESFKRGISVP